MVVAWLGRGTLHLVGRDDYPWLLGLTAPTRLATSRRRLAQEGVAPDDAERAVKIVERALADDGPADPRRSWPSASPPRASAPRARPRRTCSCSPRCAGSRCSARCATDGGHAFALTRDWLGAAPPPELAGAERDAALAELARRYLAGHGPAAPADLAAWSGLPLRDARAGLEAIASELAERDDDLVDLAAREPAPDAIPARLLPAFDPYLLGWKDRAFAVPARHAEARASRRRDACAPRRPSTGCAVGTWSAPGGEVELELFGRVRRRRARRRCEADADDVARFAQAP